MRKRRAVPNHADPATWFRRGEVARLLNCGRANIVYLQFHGTLHPRQDDKGEWRFDPDEIYAYASTHPKAPKKLTDDGEITAAAFALFDEGVPRRRVILRLRITGDHADELYEDWSKETFDDARAARLKKENEAKHEREERDRKEQRHERIERANAALGQLSKVNSK